MRRLAAILGLLGVGLMVLVAVVLTAIFGAQLLVTFVWVIVPAAIGACIVSAAVMALVAVSYTDSRPKLSSVLYFSAGGLGLVALWIAGQLLIGGALGYMPLLAAVPLIVAGMLVRIDWRHRMGRPGAA